MLQIKLCQQTKRSSISSILSVTLEKCCLEDKVTNLHYCDSVQPYEAALIRLEFCFLQAKPGKRCQNSLTTRCCLNTQQESIYLHKGVKEPVDTPPVIGTLPCQIIKIDYKIVNLILKIYTDSTDILHLSHNIA